MRNNQWTWIALLGLGAAALVFALAQAFPGVLDQQDAQMRLVYGVSLLALVGSSAVLGMRRNAGLALKQAVSWIAIALALVIAYGYRAEFSALALRTQSELMPTRAVDIAPGTVSLRGDRSGHFLADALVDGTHIRFLVDTGASVVALTEADARRLGYDLSDLRFDTPFQTANGVALAARIRLPEVKIGTITVYDVRASVMQSGLTQSLLGMSFLGELDGVEFSGDRLILRQ